MSNVQDSVPLLLSAIVGLPGSGVGNAADAVVSATAADVRWIRAKTASASEV